MAQDGQVLKFPYPFPARAGATGPLLLALILLAGCATPPPPADQSSPTGWSAPAPASATPLRPPVAHPPTIVAHPLPPVAPANLPPANLRVWTSLHRWAQQHQFGPPRRISTTPVTAYALTTPRGTLTLVIGSHEAAWNGTVFFLGYPPEIVDNEVFVQGVDLRKNLAPLLLEPPLALPPGGLIVIDPGHGGMNGGTVSVLDQRPEKEFTLDTARRLKPLLEAEGWRVQLTRTADQELTLSNRVAIADACHADLFISLHFNSAGSNRKQRGLETYCLTPVGLPSNLTRGEPDPIYQPLPNNEYDIPNLQLALALQSAVLHGTGLEDRGVRRARFMGVLHGQSRPAVLIEEGFLSCPEEAQRIESPGFRQRLAESIAAALRPRTVSPPELTGAKPKTNSVSALAAKSPSRTVPVGILAAPVLSAKSSR